MTTASLVLLGWAAATVLGGWFAFRRAELPRPPLGVLSLGDVVVMLVAVVLVPVLYLALPPWVVAGLLLLATGSALIPLLTSLLASPGGAWLATLALLGADVAAALLLGPPHPLYLAINNTALVLLVLGITVLWAQSGLRARDAAVLGGALAIYDLIATVLLPLTDEMLARLASLPLMPVVAWGSGEGGWLGIGLGDLLLATVFPLVMRKAFNRAAGLWALALGLAAIVGVVGIVTSGLLPGTFPVMVVLGPLMVVQTIAWRRRHGPERTTRQYLQAEPPRRSLTPHPARRLGSVAAGDPPDASPASHRG
jgi:hypothetical protein